MTTDALATSTTTAPPFAWARTAGTLALLGATLGVACDAMHVHSGTTEYLEPTMFSMAWWVVPLFASAAVALGLGPIVLERALGRRDPAPSAGAAFTGLGLFVVAYVLSCFVRGASAAVMLLAIGAGLAATVDRRPIGAICALAAAVAGPAVEIALVHAGLFEHHDATFLGIPLWLPALYVCASYGVSGIARTLAAR